MSLFIIGVCRGERCVYVILGGVSGAVSASACLDAFPDARIPCGVYPLDLVGKKADGHDAEDLCVVALPQLSVDTRATVRDVDNSAEITTVIKEFPSKISSRLLSKKRPELAAAVRGIDGANCSGHVRVEVMDIWPSGPGNVVWRVRATFPSKDKDSTPQLRLLGRDGQAIPCSPIVMEDQLVPDGRDQGLLLRRVTFSVEVADSLRDACVIASLGTLEGFLPMTGHFVDDLAARGRYLAGGGAAVDGAYERWFDLHRATSADIARQRNEAGGLEANVPLISIVMPVYQTPPEFLRKAIGSVVRQSWQKWELVIVNASPNDAGVTSVLHEFLGDSHITVVETQNRPIPENTNVGIERASGGFVCFMDHDDVLEPDALWRYAEAIAQDPEVDLLYCDEDRLRDGHPSAPAFKPEPQLTLLQSYNYAKHLLMVSRHVLEVTEQPGTDVNGAQDYDFTLKAFEAARHVTHIPRVLYHWREHAGSTAGGGDQKPFAHEAGKRALAGHLQRRGLSATVEDGRLPYTYRVRYDLPQPAPLTSIVIPTRDHVDLLRTCVDSILERTTYPSFEIILVENGSGEQETFSYYDELTRDHENVRVVIWTPKAGQEDFNYSAICNEGAKAASGDVLVFLNNDTEVVDGDWLNEMVGQLQQPRVGIVGAKLLFADDLVQHCGVVATPSGDNCHVNQNLMAENMGYAYSAAFPMEWPMVTGACQAIKRSTFERLGGYDEHLAVGFNDSDLCLSAREAGLACVCTPYALLHHREFSSRGREEGDPAKQARLLMEKTYVMGKHAAFYASGDHGVNPNLNQWTGHWELQW